MTATIETIIGCDGGDGCPYDGSYADGDCRDESAKEQRRAYWMDGWVYRNGKDYCPDCAKRLGFRPAKDPNR